MSDQPEPGSRLYCASLNRWVRVRGPLDGEFRVAVDVEGIDGRSHPTAVSTLVLFPTDHYPAQIGTRDPDGSRTHTTPGEVCAGCSDALAGRWVPVSECPKAWVVFEAHHDAHGYGAWLWLS